jgi:molybdopterin synthase catalytic subunit
MIALTYSPIDYAELVESVRDPQSGGVVLFLGTVRELTGDQITTHLDYEAYAPMAEKALQELETEVCGRWPVRKIVMVHRLGRMDVSEISVAVAVSCPHRVEAFAACQYAIDQLKIRVPIWKQENSLLGTQEWVHPESS